MRISEQWLREWVDIDSNIDAIAERLTMAGLEIDTIEPAAPDLSGVLIGEVVSWEPHPHADKLGVCDVDLGGARQTIVCGAPNVAAGIKAPVATVGTTLPGGLEITASELRGVVSHGMLCSAAELALGHDSDGLWLLPTGAPVGRPLAEYLGLPDWVLDVELTPDRGDCLSVRGVAREVAVAFDVSPSAPKIAEPESTIDATPNVSLQAPDLCPAYAAQIVEAEVQRAETPVWMRERLRRAGVRPINLPVDIGNAVMLELGQPMHAFDADKLAGRIRVRRAVAGERMVTLDDQDVELLADTLVIADDEGPIAIAGIIGGKATAVDHTTTRVLFESACFTPAAVAGQGRRYKIHTESLHRFERGVDPALQETALARATNWLIALGGGMAGPASVAEGDPVWRDGRAIDLSADHIARLLGQPIADEIVESSLTGLGAIPETIEPGRWRVTPPSWRYDLAIEADLIEDVARVYGYDRLTAEASSVYLPSAVSRATVADAGPGEVLRQRGYSEAITYSFVEPTLHAELTGDAGAISLDNPISEQMVVMRRTLWAGLLEAWAYNVRRQQSRIRLFEQGLRFWPEPGAEHGVRQVDTLAALAAGNAAPMHWDRRERALDFFDVRGDVEALWARGDRAVTFHAEQHPALHPGRAARIYVNERPVGWVGQLAPSFVRRYKFRDLPYLFEIDAQVLNARNLVRYQSPSDQPRVARDLAFVVPDHVPAHDLLAGVASIDSKLIQSVDLFDVFRGAGVGSGFKSVALRLIFQDKTSTLADSRVDQVVSAVTDALFARCGAILRRE